MDFSHYGNPSKEWAAFIASDPSASRDGFQGNNVSQAAELRRVSNEARRLNSRKTLIQTGLSERVDITTVTVKSRDTHTIPVRRYESRRAKSEPRRALLYFHGGGYLFGDEESDDFVCASVADAVDVVVLSIIYRHSHKYQHPAQVNDSWEAFKYIQLNHEALGISLAGGMTLMGISAGAGLAVSVVLRDLEEITESGQGKTSNITGVLLSMPWLIHIDNYPFHLFKSASNSANGQFTDAPVIPQERLRLFTDLLAAAEPKDRLLNTALMPDSILVQWPKTAMIVAGMDPLRDDGLLFASRLKDLSRRPSKVQVFPGVPHGFRRWAQLEASKAYEESVLQHLSWLFQGNGEKEEQSDIFQSWDVFRSSSD